MFFNETIQAVNSIKILDANFKNLLDQCELAKQELIRLRNENEKLKNEINSYVRREENTEEVARTDARTDNGSTT